MLINPFARFGRAIDLVKPLHKYLKDTRESLKIKILRLGERIQDIIRIIDDAYRYLIIVGGDGTVKSAIESIFMLGRKFTIVPFLGGTGGELARFTGILSLRDLANALMRGRKREIDTFSVNVKYPNKKEEKHMFVANMQIGHFSHSIKETPSLAKRLFGSNGYMIGVLKAVFKRVNKNCIVTCDNRLLYDGPIFTIHLGNLKTTRGGVPVTPLASPSDGKVDILLAKSISKIDALKTLPLVLQGKHLNHPAVIYEQARELKIVCDDEHLAIDGEYLGTFSEASIKYETKIEVLCSK